MTKRVNVNLTTIIAVLIGIAVGVTASIGGLLISPHLAGVSSEFRCVSCHQLHGAITLDNVPFNALVLLTGDVPEPKWITVNDILPYRHLGEASITLQELLAQNGVHAFKEVSLISTDGGLVTLAKDNIGESSLVLPYLEGIRFQDANLHVSTWLKGISKIIIVGEELPIVIDGRATSMGRLLRENTLTVVSERSFPMYRSEEDGQVREGEYSHLHTGAPISGAVAHPDFTSLTVIDAQGETYTVNALQAEQAILTIYYGQPTLLLPDLHRGEWISEVVRVESIP